MQGDERHAGGCVGEHAGGPHDQQSVAERHELVVASKQPVPCREGDLHAVGETDDHDQRGHHVQEHVQAESEPAEYSERHQDGQKRRRGRNDHERWTAEKDDRDQATDSESQRVVDQPVALDCVADLELHHRHARELGFQTGAFQIGFQLLADRRNRWPQFVRRRR